MPTTSIAQKLKDYIMRHQCNLGAGTSEEQVQEFERRYDVLIPSDLRTYFLELNGTDGDYAYGIIRFWNLDEVRSITEEIAAKSTRTAVIVSRYRDVSIANSDSFFVFADCMHEAQLYAIRLSAKEEPNPVILLTGSDPVVVAESFSHFVEQYVTKPKSLGLVVD